MKKKRYLSALAALLWLFLVSSAQADIFYSVSNYIDSSVGIIEKNGGSYQVNKNIVVNLGMDAWGFTFRDHSGAERAMIREYNYGPDDMVYVWNPLDWSRPEVNRKDWASNIRVTAAEGKYLYLATYESYNESSAAQETGEVIRVDMERGYVPDKRSQYGAFTSGEHVSSPHGEAIHIQDGRVYVLFGISYNEGSEYDPGEIIEYDLELNELRKVRLESQGISGKNPMRMAYRDGKLYVACVGEYQGPDSWGDIWEVDLQSMTSRRVLDGHSISYDPGDDTAAVGIYGIQFASDGTAYILAGSYDAEYTFQAKLFLTTADRLAAGDAGTVIASYENFPGYSWDILYDEAISTLWCMTGVSLEARDKDGRLVRTFQPSDLGDNIYSLSLLRGDAIKASEPNLPDAPTEDFGDNEGSGGGGGCDAGIPGLAGVMALTCIASVLTARKRGA
ncbi:MAG: hypothetical protein LBI74_06190 [Synergistaceae bacterium]|jgi:hypothetical protein|nr:hypothetical protein [Synergistaceae bacterium]